MVFLDKSYYDKVVEPLAKVKVNNLFARAVVKKQVTGSIYVDCAEKPMTFYVLHPYGMSLLFGETEKDDFNRLLVNYLLNTSKVRNNVEWLQAFPGSWDIKLSVLLNKHLITSDNYSFNDSTDKVIKNTRVNFKFNADNYLKFKHNCITTAVQVIRTDEKMFETMQGTVVPKHFWDNADAFLTKGVGFSVIQEGIPVSTAYSAYIIDNQLELGIETLESYRGKGLALYTCSALIDYCLKNNFEPVWSCRLENTGSYKLAQKLGFEPALTIPYYKLPFS